MNDHRTASRRFPPHEHGTLERLLLGDLRDMLDEQPDADATRWLLAVLETLLELLPERFAYEERGGYLSEVIDEFPTWDTEVIRLRHERSDLYCRLRQLRDQIRHTDRNAALSDGDARALRDWINCLESHDHQETDLLQTAVNLEIGGEG